MSSTNTKPTPNQVDDKLDVICRKIRNVVGDRSGTLAIQIHFDADTGVKSYMNPIIERIEGRD